MSADFEFREKIEEWVEGVLDVLYGYLKTVVVLNLRVWKSMKILVGLDDDRELTRPGLYLLLCYAMMCLLIKDVDFSDRFFSVDIARSLDALGVLNAAKTVEVESIVVAVFPAILVLLFFVLLTQGVLELTGDDLDRSLLRRNYAYGLGGVFLMIGTVAGGYHHIVRPLAERSWWLGLPVHMITMLPLVSAIMPFVALQHVGRPQGAAFYRRWIAVMIPLLGFAIAIRLLIGSFYLMDYMRLK